MAIIDNAIYVDGVRTENPVTLSETFERMRERDGMGWIGLYRPSEEEIREVAEEFGIHALVVEDAEAGIQAAKAGGFCAAGIGPAANSLLADFRLQKLSDLMKTFA